MKNTTASHRQRIYTFDLLRGVAVLTMILAHSVYFLHRGDTRGWIGLENFGNTVSFVTFLLVSGAVTWVSFLGRHHAGEPVNRKRIVARIGLFLLAYYALALVMAGADILKAVGFERLRLIGDILSFRNLPGFTEFFPPFIFYSALVALMPRLFAAMSHSIRGVVLSSLLAFVSGFLLYQIPVGPLLKPWVALLAGALGLYRFPILQYLPVFLLGLYWGRETMAAKGLHPKRVFVARLGWWFASLALAAWALAVVAHIPVATIFNRWPPTIPFLSLGLAFAFGMAFLFYQLRQLRRVVLLRDLLLVFGQNAVGIFWSHIFLLGLFAMAGGAHVSSVGVWLFMFAVLVVSSLALTTFLPFNFRLALTAIRGSHEEEEEALEKTTVFKLSEDVVAAATRPTLKKRHQLGISFIALATAALVIPAATQQIAVQRQARGSLAWWSNAYAYRQRVTLENPQNFVTLQPNDVVAIHLNHRALVDQGKSRPDGSDLKLVYWTGQTHIVTTAALSHPDSPDTTVAFHLPAKIEGARPDQYYSLYYGSFIESATVSPISGTPTTLMATFGTEESYPLVASLTKQWSLVGDPNGDTVSFHLAAATPYESETVTYEVLDTNLSGTMERSSPTSWEATVPVALLPAGEYKMQATLVDADGHVHMSQLTGFHRSAPLYVAWTIDWEGYDANQTYLDAMEAIATQYQLPMTHFFNPRIYVTKTISAQRAKTVTEWLQRRLQLGDGYGLHLHLFYDFVEQAGVTVRKDPNWGDSGDGYGVPLGAYSQAEQARLIVNANNLLFANGLPKATVFRAGGWFANTDTLAALEQLGFTADSSARTEYVFGRNSLHGYWHISPTTRPFYPSRSNQDVSSPGNNFSVLEIPNNGADSYAFIAQAMIDRFTANDRTGILTEPQQITYLTHPHWFDDKEQARVRQLFTTISRYTYMNDDGPVIFTTTQTIANTFAHAE